MASVEGIKKFTRLIKGLLPLGRAWETVREDAINLFPGLAVEFCRIKDRAKDLLTEIDPGTSTELLEDWETLLGLPDDCTPATTDLIERRTQARQKLAAVGGISADFYEQVADDLGFEAFVSDAHPFKVGHSVVGDFLYNSLEDRDIFKAGFTVGEYLYNWRWDFCFIVNVEATTVEAFEVGNNVVGDPLVSFGNELLECTIAKLKPAHTCSFFTFR
jgi:uncharacterized protein YmfQ (DUF2313 family)